MRQFIPTSNDLFPFGISNDPDYLLTELLFQAMTDTHLIPTEIAGLLELHGEGFYLSATVGAVRLSALEEVPVHLQASLPVIEDWEKADWWLIFREHAETGALVQMLVEGEELRCLLGGLIGTTDDMND